MTHFRYASITEVSELLCTERNTLRLVTHKHRRGEKVQEIELSAGTIEYEDTAGSGPIVVLLHGLIMDSSLWRHVVCELHSDYRCLVPTMPLVLRSLKGDRIRREKA